MTSSSLRVRRAVVVGVLTALSVVPVPVSGQPHPDDADPPSTRQEALRRQREARAVAAEPYEAGRIERLLSRVENEQTVENLFDTPSPSSGGYYLTLGNITSGAGLTLGTGYTGRARLGRQIELSARGAASMRRYLLGELEASMPRLARGRAFAGITARRRDYTQEDFFGPGPNSQLEDRTSFRYLQTEVDAVAGIRFSNWLSMGGGVAYLNPSITTGKDQRYPSIEEAFTDAEAPGLLRQPDFRRHRVFAQFDFTRPPANPRTGGRYRVTYSYFDDRDFDEYSFQRWEFDAQQYVSFLHGRRVLAFRGYGSFSDPQAGQTVPFYLQSTLGGSHSLRGFNDFRLRDRHLVLLQAEYRWELFPALKAVLFYDTGKVAPLRREINFKDFESNWGTGFRIGTDSDVFFRVDWALGSRDGQHLMFKFSNVF